MADEQDITEEETVEEEAPPTSGSGRTLILAFVGFVILAETGMFFFLVPSAEDVSLMAQQNLIQSVQEVDETEEEDMMDENELHEFQLGMYGEVFSPHDTERDYRVELKLYGLIRAKDVEKMGEEFTTKEGRIRSKIRFRLRNSSIEELRDNNLGLLERRILTACNHLLEEDLLLGVGFKSYQLIEQ